MFLRRLMDTRVKPAYDHWTHGAPFGMTGVSYPPAFSRSTACQPMSRRQNPSGHWMRSTASYAQRNAYEPVDRIHCPDAICRRYIEHAPAIGENVSVLRDRAGVEDLGALDLGGLFEPIDAGALGDIAGIALRRDHHGQCCFRKPAQIKILQLSVA